MVILFNRLSQKIAYNSITATQLVDKICNVYVIVNMYVDNLLRRGILQQSLEHLILYIEAQIYTFKGTHIVYSIERKVCYIKNPYIYSF